ncbi:hypothetical protein BDV40DRAFT_262131 [Aspergillus tamarii]|uniref:Uncharacterized protein n=1 Tax=Aspergillus tamarii TaxID=41984 RepID=A0A5N6UYW7_ASPTM|nr:hypothetical protein BDV40DRAFT_262131 [Aspergillus tamarii]
MNRFDSKRVFQRRFKSKTLGSLFKSFEFRHPCMASQDTPLHYGIPGVLRVLRTL